MHKRFEDKDKGVKIMNYKSKNNVGSEVTAEVINNEKVIYTCIRGCKSWESSHVYLLYKNK